MKFEFAEGNQYSKGQTPWNKGLSTQEYKEIALINKFKSFLELPDKVPCMICGALLHYVNQTHLDRHGVTSRKYRERFPKARIMSKKMKRKPSRGKMVPCGVCGELIYRESGRLKVKMGHFCSPSCYHEYLRTLKGTGHPWIKAQRVAQKKKWEDPESRNAMIEGLNKAFENPEYRNLLRDIRKELWKDPDYVKKARRNRKPTNPESILINLIEEIGLPYEYTGNGGFTISNMNPDFIHASGAKKVIEVFGDYWHRGEDPQDRIDAFAEYGWDCLVIWERELNKLSAEEIGLEVLAFSEMI